MKIKGKIKGIQVGTDLKPEIVIGTNKIGENIEKLKDKELEIELKEYKNQRSLNANSYYWSLMNILKDILGLPINELHLNMLENYGQGTYIKVDRNAKHIIESTVKYYKLLEETEEYAEYLVLLGSSEMNTKEFWNLINGVIQECENVGIPTLNKDDIYELMAERESKHS